MGFAEEGSKGDGTDPWEAGAHSGAFPGCGSDWVWGGVVVEPASRRLGLGGGEAC